MSACTVCAEKGRTPDLSIVDNVPIVENAKAHENNFFYSSDITYYPIF
ncbi:hypothetical protein SPAR9_0610 [Streptococcus pneumoniae GA06083]|uniref:Uncharacterized protein n=1 Tax=Streptococcus pneumoniae (strain JJA) TaxID=488222 RepID=C1CD33_STRZJ|nr:hypothetical protein SPJ_0617 [Streptococcus pneumoniae JJA]ADM90793.1 hypothetical protein SP670_0725 [Streptococcus pneumoniae 670-6B]EDT97554.1 hypothetical protein SP305906_0655 [Streptococcus pneumoniae CDC3059-06]EHD31726.1 hypothetical protein SPAR19_0660 [Streptococcus pneumoniae GA11184]EHD80302.1 hypothetical protein SPAR144_0602 [Streptococcus pneumoniae NP170]EHE03175.1 hypothetical protein SPAR39_0665 [Streptococcus pneumoniae GA16242]EHE30514.1 hypothetical protein SPAR78_067